MPKKPVITNTTVVAESKLFYIEQVDLSFSNGEQRVYERIRGNRKRGAVMIVPLLDHNTVLLVREYAGGTDAYELGLPKGLIEDGETPEAAANREMQEEIGYASDAITYLRSMSSAPGHMAGKMHIVIARDLYPQQLEGDEPEPIEVVPWSLDNLGELVARDDFSEARSIAALLWVKYLLNKE